MSVNVAIPGHRRNDGAVGGKCELPPGSLFVTVVS